MYNAYQAPGQYGSTDYNQYATAPPGMALPPGVAPGMPVQDVQQQPNRMGGFPSNFQPPPNMPNINFSAPVIRLGTTGPARQDQPGGRDDRDRGGRRAGMGSGPAGETRDRDRDRLMPVQPPTKEEIIKTIYVGGITEAITADESVERILRAAGNLRRWIRAVDADDKPCKFGFAEYDDPESLSTAIEVLKNVEVPVKRKPVKEIKSEIKSEDSDEDEEEKIQLSKLVIVADENSTAYIEQWEESQPNLSEEQKEMHIDQAREALDEVLKDLMNPSSQKDDLFTDRDGDVKMGEEGLDGEIVTVAINAEDELADIPAEMRETVAKEIAAFRDRSNRRDLERLQREEEIEQQEKNRMVNGRASRLTSPPPSAPSGPAGGANGIPVGPRDRSILNAPAGPKGFGQQIPRDYQKGVSFVNGTGLSTASAFEDDDTDASDEELERRRNAQKDSELEKQFLDQERRWLNRERSRTAAVEREKNRDKDESAREEEEKNAMAKRLSGWNDDVESSRKAEEYYADRSLWIRNRAAFRTREAALDETDRMAEQRERAKDFQRRERAGALADDFLSRQGDELRRQAEEEEDREDSQSRRAEPTQQQPARFKLSLGAAAAQKAAQAAQSQKSKRTVAEVEGLLEDEEDEGGADGARRTLIPIQFDQSTSNAADSLSDEERAQLARQLAAEIPNDKEGLWRWDVKWEFVDEAVIEERLKPFVEKKVVEYLGVQEQMVVDVVVNTLRSRGKPDDLVSELEGVLDEEADVLVRKLWRMVIFFSESEKRGLST